MSGIIGGAGSKSGVIGTTELDYEYGTWTPSSAGWTIVGTFTSAGKYTRIGKHVWIWAWLKGAGSIALSGTSSLSGGLPFAIQSVGTTNWTWTNNAAGGTGFAWNVNMYAGYGGNTISATTNDTVAITMQYITD
jgi:hypothetical protein